MTRSTFTSISVSLISLLSVIPMRVILSLEPVIAGFVAYFFAGDILTPRAYFGAALMVAGVFIIEIDFGSLMKKIRRLSHGNDL